MSWTVIILALCGVVCLNAAFHVQGNTKHVHVVRTLGHVLPRLTYLVLYALAAGFAALSIAQVLP